MNNENLKEFINTARTAGLTDEEIIKTATSTGWDVGTVKLALHGIQIPTPEVSHEPTQPSQSQEKENASKSKERRPSTLQTVLHHVSLWFFLAVAIPAIIMSSYFHQGDSWISVETLNVMTSILIASGVIYAIFYFLYVRAALRTKEVYTAGKVFSIITISLYMVGTLISAIVFIAGVIEGDYEGGWKGALTAAAITFVVQGITALTCNFATFANRNTTFRKTVLISYPVIMLAILGTMIGFNAVTGNQAQQDETTAAALTESAEKISEHARTTGALPTQEEAAPLLSEGVTYREPRAVEPYLYQLCAEFVRDTAQEDDMYYSDSGNQYPIDDNYPSTYQFASHLKGEQCFNMENYTIREKLDAANAN